MSSLKIISESLEEFLVSLRRIGCRVHAGLEDAGTIAPFLARYSSLFSTDTFEELKHLALRGAPEDQRRARRILPAVVGGILDREASRVMDAYYEKERSSSITLEGEEIPFRYVRLLLRDEPDQRNRHTIFEASLPVLEDLSLLRKEQISHCQATLQSLGYPSFRSLFEHLTGISLDFVQQLAESINSHSKERYAEALEEITRSALHAHEEAGSPPHHAGEWDLPYLSGGELYDEILQGEALLPTLRQVFAHAGLDTSNRQNLILDWEQRPKKNPQILTYAVRIPDEIVLLLSPQTGVRAWQSALREAGKAALFAHSGADLPFEERAIGNTAIQEGFGLLFGDLLENPRWWMALLKVDPPASFLPFARFLRLLEIRLACARLHADLALLEQNDPDRAKAHLEEWTRLTFKSQPIYASCQLFYSSHAILAWSFAAQLKAFLEERHGAQWFASPEATLLLKKLWSFGLSLPPGELLRTIGFVDLDPRFLLNWLEAPVML